ncbi:Na/Pi symporter [Bacillus testis]|uniref:Na/Pi symporter n=1 Tax=Bacillus testis TaxID=1622072 RepID=UPI00067F1D0D|nr:Na/Pi symporter [Bacillus testis]
MREIFLFVMYIILFLSSMALLRHGLFKLTGENISRKLEKLTSTPLKSFMTGMVFTALLQSSSAIMVMTVGLVSVGAITFQRSIGIILGSNIGTTVTAEFMTFSFEPIIGPALIIGFICMLFRHTVVKHTGMAIFGLFMIFFCIGRFTALSGPLMQIDAAAGIFRQADHHLFWAVVLGAAIAATIHSGTATIAIAMGFIAGGQLAPDTGIAIMLGSNIGTCVTGYIASLGAGQAAKWTAYAHIWLNVLGVVVFYPFIHTLQHTAALFTDDPAKQLAHASVIFNLACSLLVLPFTGHFSRFITTIHRSKSKKI